MNIPIPAKIDQKWVVHQPQDGTIGFDPQTFHWPNWTALKTALVHTHLPSARQCINSTPLRLESDRLGPKSGSLESPSEMTRASSCFRSLSLSLHAPNGPRNVDGREIRDRTSEVETMALKPKTRFLVFNVGESNRKPGFLRWRNGFGPRGKTDVQVPCAG